jgi:CRP-like cAMP-binding protein
MRSPGGLKRLIVTPSQASLLSDSFGQPRTVPEVLAHLVDESRCPPLLVFYELVLQANDAGVLVTGFEPEESTLSVRWPVRLPSRVGLILGTILSSVSGLILVASVQRWREPANAVEIAGGWLAACLLVSIGEMLAASVISGSRGEVRDERFCWRTPFPHFRTDTTEAIMGGKECEKASAMLRLAPVVVGAVGLAWRLPEFFAPVMAAVLYVLGPWNGSAAMQWLVAHFGEQRFTVGLSHLFEPMRDDHWLLWSAWWRKLRSRFGALRLVWAIAWTGLLAVFVSRCVPGAATSVPRWLGASGPGRPILVTGVYTLVGGIVVATAFLFWAAFKHWRIRREWRRPIKGSDVRDTKREALDGGLETVLGQVPLFSGCEAQDLTALAQAVEQVQFGRGQWVIKENEPGESFFMVLEGELEVLKTLPNRKRSTTIGWIGPGDCFGEIALLEETPRTASIRARSKCRLLKLDRGEFERLILSRVGAARLREILQHVRYLNRLTFMSGWPVSDLCEFAKRCKSAHFKQGTFVLRRGEANHFFYLIYDGWFEARNGERVLRRMGPGDYFGEISLLENWQATADVVALEEGRCLTMGRTDFLALFARGFRIAIRMEAIAGQRLGTDVFISK